MHICKAVLYNVKCDLKFYRSNHDPVQDFHLRISVSLYYGMQSVHGEIKWYQVTHSISHHYVTTGSAAIALHTLAYMCTHTHTHTSSDYENSPREDLRGATVPEVNILSPPSLISYELKSRTITGSQGLLVHALM